MKISMLLCFMVLISTGLAGAQTSSGATFGGSGMVIIGRSSGGTLIANSNYVFSDGETLNFKLGGQNLTLSGNEGALSLDSGTTFSPGAFTLTIPSDTNIVTGTLAGFNSLAPGSFGLSELIVTPQDYVLNTDYMFSSSNPSNLLVINFNPVPEPSTVWLMAASLIVMAVVALRRFARCSA